MFHKILLPTDGTELCDRAVDAGIALATTVGASVVAVHAAPLTTHVVYGHAGPSDVVLEHLRRDAQERGERLMAAVAERVAAAGVGCETKLVTDDHPWQAIIAAAEETGCDVIVMASHGRRGLSALLLGSETTKVLTHTRIPVLVIR